MAIGLTYYKRYGNRFDCCVAQRRVGHADAALRFDLLHVRL